MSVLNAVYILFLIVGLLASGVCIPLLLTFQNHHIVSEHGEEPVYFSQPLLQTAMIILGEIICILAVQLSSKISTRLGRTLQQPVRSPHPSSQTDSKWALVLFVIPSSFYLVATTLLNLGLLYSTPSIFQIIRSSIVGFAAIFSFVLLGRGTSGWEWVAVVTILAGTGIVSWSAAEIDWKGPAYLVGSQLFVAGQFVLEDHFMARFDLNPLKAMGIEGPINAVLLVVSLLAAVAGGTGVLDAKAGLIQLTESDALWQSALALVLIVAVFHLFGLAVSEAVGVLSRSIIDALRTLLVWYIAIHHSWDTFSWLELAGFSVLTLGVFIFNGLSKLKQQSSNLATRDEETTPLLA